MILIPKKMVTIAVIDKYPLLRKWVGYTLSSQFQKSSVLESTSVHAFLKAYPNCQPQLIILGMRKYSSIAQSKNFIKLIKSKIPSASLIVYDEGSSDELTILNYVDAGANGYLSKQNSVEELKKCIQTVMKGKRYINKELPIFQ